MKFLKIVGIGIFLASVTIFGAEIGEQLSIPSAHHWAPNVEARVGRPLTPVSVAGVARRTVRRCAVGVYNCSLTDPRSLDNQFGQSSPNTIIAQDSQLLTISTKPAGKGGKGLIVLKFL